MTYELNYGGEVIELPAYTFEIADRLERQESVNFGNTKFKDKCKAMYELIKYLIGADNTKRLLGDFAKVDPNEINIVYMKIVRAYSSPLNEFSESNFDQIDYSKVDKVVELINALDKAQNIKSFK